MASNSAYAARACRGYWRTRSPADPGPPCCGRCCRFWRSRGSVPPSPSGRNSSECWSGRQTSWWFPVPQPEAFLCCHSHLHPAWLERNRNNNTVPRDPKHENKQATAMLIMLMWLKLSFSLHFCCTCTHFDWGMRRSLAYGNGYTALTCCQTSELHSACPKRTRWAVNAAAAGPADSFGFSLKLLMAACRSYCTRTSGKIS